MDGWHAAMDDEMDVRFMLPPGPSRLWRKHLNGLEPSKWHEYIDAEFVPAIPSKPELLAQLDDRCDIEEAQVNILILLTDSNIMIWFWHCY